MAGRVAQIGSVDALDDLKLEPFRVGLDMGRRLGGGPQLQGERPESEYNHLTYVCRQKTDGVCLHRGC